MAITTPAKPPKKVKDTLDSVNRFFAEDFQAFVQELQTAGFTLFPKNEPIPLK